MSTPAPKIQLWRTDPQICYQLQGIPGIEGLPLMADATECAYQAQTICRLLGQPLDFGVALSLERREFLTQQARAELQRRRLID